MSYIQLISDDDNSSNFNVYLSDAIKLKRDSKVALVSATTFRTYTANLKELIYGDVASSPIDIELGNTETGTITYTCPVNESSFADAEKVSFTELLSVVESSINSGMDDYKKGIGLGGLYNWNLRLKTTADGTLGFDGECIIDTLEEIMSAETGTPYEPTWTTSVAIKQNITHANNFLPTSDSGTSTSAPAYIICEDEKGLDINGGVLNLTINNVSNKWSFGLSFVSVDVFGVDYFFTNDLTTKPNEVDAPLVLEHDGAGSLSLYIHNSAVDYSSVNRVLKETYTIEEGDTFQFKVSVNGDVEFYHEELPVAYYNIAGLNMISATEVGNQSVRPFVYTTAPSISPVFLEWRRPINTADGGSLLCFNWDLDNTENDLVPIKFKFNKFCEFLGFAPNSEVEITANNEGVYVVKSLVPIQSSGQGAESWNIHLNNLPIRSYKNVKDNTRGGFQTTFIGNVPLVNGVMYGLHTYSVPQLIYIDLNNQEESINELSVEIRNATTNKISQDLLGNTIITLHLI